ncbi:hypothetical protein HYFRA_00010309 [Hymenoscyphus fraxineus]|uniref:Glucose-methanol-choline oxidoreductase N-terminal domain-containing protein n=1 Tax=Hymenoscyphus fraxineus TaxID=746836 RepID=A0A9N9KZ70_9HELO|nr:hypothetical protein HYFRA_00010309 [Hymenoscyphus fraxineus]
MRCSKSLLGAAFGLLGVVNAEWMDETWDTIVVGAGPAGIIVSTRMAQAGLKTLLLEAGGPSYGITGGDLDSRRPDWLKNTNLSRVDVPGLYKSIFASGDGMTCSLNSYGGCTIGGSSAINAGLFFEPPSSDYDLYFPAGWKSADMKNATQRLYDMQPSTNLTSMDGQRYLQSGYEATRKWLVEGMGWKDVDLNAAANDKTEVFGRPIYDYSNGQRGGPVTTYLQVALGLPNFRLESGVTVTRVERTADRATGVIATLNGQEKLIQLSTSTANGVGVILSGGAISSPGLLMHSGIGPVAQLSALHDAGKLAPGIQSASDFIVNEDVGVGLFDNPNTFIELTSPSIQSYSYSYDAPPPGDKDMYLSSRSGPYTFASQTAVFWDTLTRGDGSQAVFQGTVDSAGFGEWTDNQTITLNIYGTSGLKSTGSVVLSAPDFKAAPDGNVYYSSPDDGLEIATFIHKIFQGLPAAGITPLNIPQGSDVEEIRRYITTASQYARGSVNHFSSSCRIGRCVDGGLGVKGVKGLWVVDGSLLEPLSVNPQFGVMVVAERGSDVILGGGV